MPYFVWRGVDSMGSYKRGKQSAKSVATLDVELFSRGIALLNARPITIPWLTPAIGMADKVDFFQQLTVLIEAGILLPDALSLVARQVCNIRLQEIVCTISEQVVAGIAFSSCLESYGHIFDNLVIIQIRVAEESGTLDTVLGMIAQEYQVRLDLKKKLRSALFTPMITFIFFLVTILGVIMVILPRFVDLFKSYKQELPPVTHFLLSMSNLVLSWYSGLLVLLVLAISTCLYGWSKTDSGRSIVQYIILRLPIIGSIVSDWHIISLFRSLGYLLDGGMRLVPAVHILGRYTKHDTMRAYYTHIEQMLQEGGSFSHALVTCPDDFFSQSIIAQVIVGQESGKLATVSARIAERIQQQLFDRLTVYANLVQPLCMVLLGLLVTVLVLAVYGPICSMANMATF